MFRSVLSVFLGFVLMMILVNSYLLILSMLSPDAFPTTEQMESGDIPLMPLGINLIMLLCDNIIAVFGGYFTVAIAGKSRVGHAKALALLIVIMGTLSLSQSLAIQAFWYVALRFINVPICVYLGGRYRCNQFLPPDSTPEPAS